MNLLNQYEESVKKSLCLISKKRQFHYWNKLFAGHIKKLEGSPLTSDEKREALNFYKPYFNIKLTCHEFYKKATGIFCRDYVPDDMYYAYIDPYYNNWEMAKYMDNKCLYRTMFPGANQPILLAYRVNGFWFNGLGESITETKAIEIMVDQEAPYFIKQAVESEGGHGVIFIDKGTSRHDIQKALDSIKVDLVVQEGVTQCAPLSEINASSVNTIRLLTLLHLDGSVKIYSVILRMGIGGSKVDNASSGGITVGVDESGRLKSMAYNAAGQRFDEHPTSHVKFNNYVIPNFEKIKQLVKEQATHLPHYRLVSWDIAIDKNEEPIIIEANLKFGEIDFHQLNNGPLFGEDTEKILKEVFG